MSQRCHVWGATRGPWAASQVAGGHGLTRKHLSTMSEFNKCRGLSPLALAPLCAPRSDPLVGMHTCSCGHTYARVPSHTPMRLGSVATCYLTKMILSHTN